MTIRTSIRPAKLLLSRSTQHDRNNNWLMSANDKKRLVDVFVLLKKLDKHAKKKSKTNRESKQEKARDMIFLYIKGRGPCFNFNLFYLKATQIFNQGYIHDRYYSSFLNTGDV